MAEPTRFAFDLDEVATSLVKAQGLHEGLWSLSFEISVTIGVFGPSPAASKPGAMMQIAKVQLVQQNEKQPGATVVDAASVNPRKGRQKASDRSRSAVSKPSGKSNK